MNDMTLLMAMARAVGRDILADVSVDDVLSRVDCSTAEAQQIVSLLEDADVTI